MSESNLRGHDMHEELSIEHHDPLIRMMHVVIRVCVRLLAMLMVAVILWGVAAVCYVIYQRLVEPPFFLLDVSDIFQIYVFAIAAVALALGVACWLVGRTGKIMAQAVPPEEHEK